MYKIYIYMYYRLSENDAYLRSVSTTQLHGQSSRAELTARELGCII